MILKNGRVCEGQIEDEAQHQLRALMERMFYTSSLRHCHFSLQKKSILCKILYLCR